jgi:hypothetical protein
MAVGTSLGEFAAAVVLVYHCNPGSAAVSSGLVRCLST